jgi:cell division septal protein FtsQ
LRSGGRDLKSAFVTRLDDGYENPYHHRRRRTKRRRNAGLIFLFWLIGAIIIGGVLYWVNAPSAGNKRTFEAPGSDVLNPRKK